MRLARFLTSFSLALLTSSAIAQSAREQAVAIDRVPSQPPDLMEAERIGPALNSPWSIAFLPDGRMLVTEKHGGIRLIARDGSASGPLGGGPPNVFQQADSGLHDVVLDPDFAESRLVYVAFVEGNEAGNRTAIWRARLDGERLVDGRVIFRVNRSKRGPGHPGGRMLFLPDNTLLLTVGDGYDYRDQAQDPASHFGKVLRLTREGTVPRDNPFVGRAGYAPEIWTLGHRNIQGLVRDAATGSIWSHEHGPRGGDEINLLEAGRNYGWPRTSNGIDYDGTLITERAHAPDITGPRLVWSPSIAPSGLALYRGPLFPELEGRLLVGGLASRSLVQVRVNPQNGLLAEETRRLAALGLRIRDIRVAPDGNIYWLSDGEQGGLFRVLPRAEQLIAAPAGHDLSIRDLAFLIGSWTGESRLQLRADATPRAETSRTSCRPALRGRFIECLTTFSRAQGRGRDVLSYYVYNPETRRLETRTQDSNWGGISTAPLEWNAAERTLIAMLATRDAEGRPATERVVIRLSADGNSIEHTESLRVDGSEAWQQTFRWTMRRGQ